MIVARSNKALGTTFTLALDSADKGISSLGSTVAKVATAIAVLVYVPKFTPEPMAN